MVEDITNLRLSRLATHVATEMKESGLFEDALTAAKFGMAYAVKYNLDDVNSDDKIAQLDAVYDATGNNYNVGSVDPDHYIADFIGALYPGCTTPYRYARVLMCYGLNKLGDFLDEGKLFPINQYM
ncbi:hypothetical protein LJ046_06655 [Lactobacillus delbrueckii subsp. jakobsenii ZN7a-9 = DSM 26046]|jgi:hypothetical protein|uniref:hypothetical protein n=1 Tax=Lactobacillus delbrueckii TaxID=1584 RepID=UPI00032DD018|nr:hypothetical protein [Lactobacillus delbrueckii]APG73336.1 hypothetical protein LJ046_06655 [Lactobacillus delbrueckii subsp. jakobsenii ZN7a-9 = DSM 26046]EOD03404.1 hypothetical protein B506_01165 [Lactobacillus delbrueckii subsp. jakobsenii ZN7a-9 = DSM 26046]TDG65227.1 hypothetical protein C5L19_000975 [Lactobacillus delbrueckii subsp. jakobsenii]